MIIRILGDGQFRLDDNLVDRVNKIDNRIVNHVSQGNRLEYTRDLANLISTIKDRWRSYLQISLFLLPTFRLRRPGRCSATRA